MQIKDLANITVILTKLEMLQIVNRFESLTLEGIRGGSI